MKPTFTTIGLYANPNHAVPAELLDHIVLAAEERSLSVIGVPACAAFRSRGIELVPESEFAERAKAVISIGGDGTLLGAARLLAGTRCLLWSIHIGRLGFLTDVMASEVPRKLLAFFNGDYAVREIELISAHARQNGRPLVESTALNEITVEAGTGGVMISLAIAIDGHLMSNIDGNGVIVATPSGSTAYSLAAGGPILLENAEAFVVNPICPHTLTNRPVIVSNHSVVTVRPRSRDGHPQLVADGRVLLENLDETIQIEIRRSGLRTRMIKSSSRNQFEILSEKLGWGNPRKNL